MRAQAGVRIARWRVVAAMVVATMGAGVCAGQPAGGSVTGKVVQEPGGQGIRKVVVELTATGEGREGEAGKQYRTATDALGVFRFEGVEKGRYSVEISRPGYFAPNDRSAASNGQGRWVDVIAGNEVSGLVYKMQAAGVISGKIMDAEGDPVGNVPVEAVRQGKRAREQLDYGRGVTNDVGEYRIANLRPGQYEVCAEPPADVEPAPNPADKGRQREKAVYSKTYFPGTLDERLAGTVQVTPGGMATANLGLLTNRAYRVSGTVSGVGAAQAQMVQLLLVSRGAVVQQSVVDESGKFEFPSVQPGTYETRVLILSGAGDGQRPSTKVEAVRTPIVVDGADVTGLDLVADTGGTVRGKFRVEDDAQVDWTQMTASLIQVEEAGAVPGSEVEELETAARTAEVQDDGTFEVNDVPGGMYQLAVGAKSEVYWNYYTKSITESGREVADTGFAVSGGAGLEILVSAKGCSIEGTVTDKDGKPVTDAEVVAAPASGQRMRPDSYQSDKTNAQGQFTLRGMNPGKYVVVALEGAHENSRSAEFFAKYSGVGETVELGEGERKTVGLKVGAASNQ